MVSLKVFLLHVVSINETSIEHSFSFRSEDECQYTGRYDSCGNGMFCCQSGECISNNLVCNYNRNCHDNTDERGCPKCVYTGLIDSCGAGQFCCKNRKCIPTKWICNDINECGDQSDEITCPKCHHKKTSEKDTCGYHHFCCENGRCVPNKWICDGIDDCHDNTDEIYCAARKYWIFNVNYIKVRYCQMQSNSKTRRVKL